MQSAGVVFGDNNINYGENTNVTTVNNDNNEILLELVIQACL